MKRSLFENHRKMPLFGRRIRGKRDHDLFGRENFCKPRKSAFPIRNRPVSKSDGAEGAAEDDDNEENCTWIAVDIISMRTKNQRKYLQMGGWKQLGEKMTLGFYHTSDVSSLDRYTVQRELLSAQKRVPLRF